MSEVRLECRLARSYTMAQGAANATAYLLVKVIPDKAAGIGRLPLNIALVLDVSASMSGEKLACAKEAASLVVQSLTKDDWLSLIVFNGKAKAIVPRRRVDDKNVFFSQIRNMDATNGTRMHTGMSTGLAELGMASPAAVNRILLFTDGETEEEEKCLDCAREAAQNKVVTSTFGIGDDYNEELLGEISRATLGGAYAVRNPSEIKDHFLREVQDAAAIGITNASFTLNLAKGVGLEQMHRVVPNIAGLDPRAPDSRMYVVDIGGLDAMQFTGFFATLLLPQRPAGQVRVVQVSLKYDVPSLQIKDKTEKSDVVVEYTADRDLLGQVDREVMGYFDQIEAQRLIVEAAKAAQAGNAPAATQKLTQAKLITQRIGNVAMTQNLAQAIDELQRQGTVSPGAQKTIRLGSSHTVRLEPPRQS